jgi:hypothetical protein
MPLHQNLYERLQRRFGDVAITHEGEEMEAYFTEAPCVVDRHGRPCNRLEILSAGEEYLINCPFFKDTRKRLSINHAFGCWDPEVTMAVL